MKLKTNKKGFTLLEILVVVSIIGILIVLGAAAFTTAQRKGRDARRRGDMKSIQNGFEQYYADSGSEYNATCSSMDTAFPGGLPSDPKPSQSYSYSCTTSTYCVCALLDEDDSGNASGVAAGTCPYTSASPNRDYFCVSNLQ